MMINAFCWCCGKETKIYRNKTTGKTNKYCSECVEKYTLQERRSKEINLIFNIMKPVIKNQTEKTDAE